MRGFSAHFVLKELIEAGQVARYAFHRITKCVKNRSTFRSKNKLKYTVGLKETVSCLLSSIYAMLQFNEVSRLRISLLKVLPLRASLPGWARLAWPGEIYSFMQTPTEDLLL